MNDNHVDVVIIGAGISGIAAACHLQQKCPGKSFAILEGREAIGGTWDLFKYPGIRSDSDMFTLGFSFKPWRNPKAIADGPAIMDYLRETVEEFGLGPRIHFNTRVERTSWSSAEGKWTVHTQNPKTGEQSARKASFVWVCTGYYRYSAGYTPEFSGIDDFGGEVVHPQLWTDDIDYADKRVIVIGSGATAMTLVPSLAKGAAHVTMLQRSPTYVVSMPEKDTKANWLREHLPANLAYDLSRWKNILYSIFVYQLSRRRPDKMRAFMLGGVREALGQDYDIKKHFSPKYDPWDQRVCLVPDGDLFKAIKSGSVFVVTDQIDRFTPKGILLQSGEELEADLVVTATGLQIQLGGGAITEVDGETINPADKFMYKGMMLSDVPNSAMSVGYTNASWTLKVELICEYVCRLLNYMDEHGYTQSVPRVPDDSMEEQPLLDFTAGYVTRARHLMPKQGLHLPWRLYQNYILDRFMIRNGQIDDGLMEFSRLEK